MTGLDVVKMIRTDPPDPQSLRADDHADRPYNISTVCARRAMRASTNFSPSRSRSSDHDPPDVGDRTSPPFVRTKSYFGPCRRRRGNEYRGPERRTAFQRRLAAYAIVPSHDPRTRWPKTPIEIFMPPNMLKAKVGARPAVSTWPRSGAPKRPGDLKTEFTDWIARDVTRLGECRDRSQGRPGADARGDLFRAGTI